MVASQGTYRLYRMIAPNNQGAKGLSKLAFNVAVLRRCLTKACVCYVIDRTFKSLRVR